MSAELVGALPSSQALFLFSQDAVEHGSGSTRRKFAEPSNTFAYKQSLALVDFGVHGELVLACTRVFPTTASSGDDAVPGLLVLAMDVMLRAFQILLPHKRRVYTKATYYIG